MPAAKSNWERTKDKSKGFLTLQHNMLS